MIDFEKRAHDLAIASIPIQYDAFKANALSSNQSDKHFDVFDAYKAAYDAALISFERDFS